MLSLGEMGMYRVVASRQVIDEAERNLRRKFRDGLPVLAEWLVYLNLQLMDNPEPEAFARWLPIIETSDAPILEAAVSISAGYFITLNTKDFTPAVAAASGLNIQTPGNFIEQIRFVIQQGM